MERIPVQGWGTRTRGTGWQSSRWFDTRKEAQAHVDRVNESGSSAVCTLMVWLGEGTRYAPDYNPTYHVDPDETPDPRNTERVDADPTLPGDPLSYYASIDADDPSTYAEPDHDAEDCPYCDGADDNRTVHTRSDSRTTQGAPPMSAPEQPILFPNGAYVYTAGPLDAYAWPGGYPIAYYPVDEHGSTVGDVLCAGCANAEAAAGFDYANDAGFIAQIIEEAHSDERCDNCSAVIAYQNWCDFCQDSVDVDEDHPHVCKPLKWQVSYSYDRREPRYPSTQRFATRQAARDFAANYRRLNYTVKVSAIVPPVMPS